MVKLYMDESGNGQPAHPLLVGAIETVDDSDEIERRIAELYRRLAARRSLDGLRSFEDFQKHGFHGSTDPLEISGPFLETMQDLSFRASIFVTDRTSWPSGRSEIEMLEYMYGGLLGDMLIRHRKASDLICYIEQNDSMKSLVPKLPDIALMRALKRLGRDETMPSLTVAMVGKTEAMSIALIDYIMLAVSRWMQSGCTTKPA